VWIVATRMNAPDPRLVVIGSSAGGIEALSQVVAGLPADFPVPVVVAQHLDPRRPSHLAEILGRHTTLPVKVVVDDMAIDKSVVYVVPENRLADIARDRFRLRPAKPRKVAPSIDLLLESAAGAFGAGLTAVILTGTGSDGSAGAWHVKQAGGTVVIENPATAKFPSMPGSVSPSLVDARADLDKIASVVCDLLAAGSTPHRGRDQQAFRFLLERIRERSGIDFSTYKQATIVRRLRGRMSATAHTSVADYVALVDRDPDEYVRLLSSLLIKVTQFLRDPKVFSYLAERTLPELIEAARRENRELRLWSAGCSTGEEAYSLAITVAEALGNEALPVRIFATDVDAAAIAFARRGLYPPGALKSLPAPLRDRYFVRTDDGYEVVRRLRVAMIFGEHDLGARAPFPRIDLVLCRNVLIYFTVPMQHVALETFAYSLRDGGRLVLGPSETVAALSEPFAEEHGRLRIYRRLPGGQTIPMVRSTPIQTPTVPRIYPRAERRAHRRRVQAPSATQLSAETLLVSLGVGVAVVDTHYDVVQINAAARRILGIHGTAFDQDFVHLAESLPSIALREAINAAIRGEPSAATHQVEGADASDDTPRSVAVHVRPFLGDSGSIQGAVIELIDVTPFTREREAHARTTRRLEKAAANNQRLLRANEELTAIVSELRTSNREILESGQAAQAGREEVETLNEEFQATNEELETLNEELTASVEELRIANDDLAARTEELGLQALQLEQQKRDSEEEQGRLESVLASLGDAVVAVDHNGATVATNVAYDRLFGGPEAEVVPEDLAGLPLPQAEWPQHRAARGERFRMEFAVSSPAGSRRWFEAVAEPLTGEDRAWGGVVAIRDVSEQTMRQGLERFMAAASHELKTPVAAIHNYLQLVTRRLDAGKPTDAGTYAGRALLQADRLGQLVERLFDVSRIQSGQLELLMESVDLVAVAREAVQAAEVLTGAPPIQLSAANRSIRLMGDPGRLGEVLLNLLTNAIEHAPRTATIDVAVRKVGKTAEVEVRDHGDGIPADSLSGLFQAYARIGQGRRSGLGLGLYVAREIVTAHGGAIEVASVPGEGATLTVRLPLTTAGSRRGVKPAASST
jgi:two-component system CheB/CheR fusion protein